MRSIAGRRKLTGFAACSAVALAASAWVSGAIAAMLFGVSVERIFVDGFDPLP